MNPYNHKTRITAATLGTLLGLAGFINHGIFEIMQGNKPTNGFFIEAIGEAHRFWTHGTEGAITVIPNFLLTGIAVSLVSLAIIVWSWKFIHTEHGATVFLLLMLALTLVGGGIGHIVLFLPTWGYATRINKPLSWWRKVLTPTASSVLAALWKPMLVLTALSWMTVMELGIFGYFPGVTDPDVLLNITFGFVLLTVLLANAAFICSFAGEPDLSSE
ncbi:MAG TPA: hypothetical protein PKW95_03480 [bacterium]|nr:hypothetical protein [bacterium]